MPEKKPENLIKKPCMHDKYHVLSGGATVVLLT